MKNVTKKLNCTIFYKFKNIYGGEQDLDALKNNKFYCPNFFELNDPMEGLFHCNKIDEKWIRIQKDRTRTCSFTDINGFCNILMWSFYACNLNGFVIEFRTNSDNIHKIKYIDDKNLEKIRDFNLDQGEYSDFLVKIYTTKSEIWKFENEYRYVGESKYFNYTPLAIYFFDRFDHFSNSIKIRKDMMCDEIASSNFKSTEELQNKFKSIFRYNKINIFKINFNDLRDLKNGHVRNRLCQSIPVYDILKIKLSN